MVFTKRSDMLSVSAILLQYQGQVLSENFRFISLICIKVMEVQRMACYIVIMQTLQTRD